VTRLVAVYNPSTKELSVGVVEEPFDYPTGKQWEAWQKQSKRMRRTLRRKKRR
jgi:hypothetical protein